MDPSRSGDASRPRQGIDYLHAAKRKNHAPDLSRGPYGFVTGESATSDLSRWEPPFQVLGVKRSGRRDQFPRRLYFLPHIPQQYTANAAVL
jgi:hypothetical protein